MADSILPDSSLEAEDNPNDAGLIERDAEYPTRTFKVNFENNQVNGFVDGLDALKQSFMFMINTQRFVNTAFTSNFGMDWKDLIGQPNDYILSEVLARVQDMILADNRFLSADYYETRPFEIIGDMVIINIEVKTIYGDFTTQINVGE